MFYNYGLQKIYVHIRHILPLGRKINIDKKLMVYKIYM